jgi:hypothetical protein
MDIYESLSANDAFKAATVPVLNEVRDCVACESHHLGWCRAVPGKAFYNIEFLAACPLADSSDERQKL